MIKLELNFAYAKGAVKLHRDQNNLCFLRLRDE
jgi:hypothetical protein